MTRTCRVSALWASLPDWLAIERGLQQRKLSKESEKYIKHIFAQLMIFLENVNERFCTRNELPKPGLNLSIQGFKFRAAHA